MVVLPRHVELLQTGGPIDIGLGQALGEMDHLLLEIRAPAVELMEEGVDGVEVRAQAGVEVT